MPPAPSPGAGLAALDAELATNERDWRALVAGLTAAQINWRPAAGRWSVGEHLAHLNLVDSSYLPQLDAMIAEGRARGLAARGASRHPWLGQHFVRWVEPPVKLKVRTPAAYVPPSAVDREGVLAGFADTRRALRERIAAAAGLDPARMRRRYVAGIGPTKWVVLSFAQWLALTAAHDRRHLWLAERTVESNGFPGG